MTKTNKKRTPLKGKPFSRLSDEQLKQYMDMFQEFIHCFKYEDKQKEALMREVWKLLQVEDVDRWDMRDFIEEEEQSEPVTTLPKKTEKGSLKITKRPVIRKRR